ncbi:glycosyltransferase family 2 protein [candidate division WWE3 bacterium]|nr:glycosyltransferase family 2 protein [candidate division WWE3 bacterium]
MKILISIVIPVFNEGGNVPELYRQLETVANTISDKYELEYLFINDGSRDNSDEVLESIAAVDQRAKYIEFSRNFGKEAATSAGLSHAHGDAVILIDSDLQHPPHLIPLFIEKWRNGADVVIGVRSERESEPKLKRLGSYWFYQLMDWIGETELTSHATDFRLMDRQVVEEFNRLTERNRITRGLIDWLGFRRDTVEFMPAKRFAGKPSYKWSQLYRLALNSFVSHSLLPLKIAGYLGIFITITAGLTGFFIGINRYILNDPWGFNFSGPALLAIFNLFLIGIVLSCLGLIALYIGFIHQEVQNRPMYISRRKINFS